MITLTQNTCTIHKCTIFKITTTSFWCKLDHFKSNKWN